MSTAQVGRPEMTVRTIEPAQHTAAKVAGWIYLFTTFVSVFAVFYVRGQLIVRGDAVQTAKNIAASERLFRIGTVCDVIAFVGVILVVALYVVTPAKLRKCCCQSCAGPRGGWGTADRRVAPDRGSQGAAIARPRFLIEWL